VQVVEGRGDFPVDMLRYDHAFCMTPIPHPNHPWYQRTFRVVVAFAPRYSPTTDRWESFGWKVLPYPLSNRTIDLLKQRVRNWRNQCHRCQNNMVAVAYAMSWFNTDLICCDCEKEERGHPDFNLARNTLRYSFSRGDYDYQGIDWQGPGPSTDSSMEI